MKNQKILYKKIRLEKEVPKNVRLCISKDDNKVYFLQNRRKIYLSDLDNDLQDIDIPGVSVSADIRGDNIVMSLNIESKKIDKLFLDPIKIRSRKKMVMLFKTCIEQAKKEYINSIQLGMIYSAYQSSKSVTSEIPDDIKFRLHRGNLEWMYQKEQESEKIHYLFSGDYLKVGSNFIDTSTGRIYETVEKIPVRFRGGVLINDIGNDWIYDVLNLKKVSKKSKVKHDFLNSSATLIITSKDKLNEWVQRIDNINRGYQSNIKSFVIDSKQSHGDITYGESMTCDYLIVSAEYLFSDNYISLADNYFITETMSMKSAYDCMRSDYVKCEKKIKEHTDPILALIYWDRMIIDSYTMDYMQTNERAMEQIFCIESFYKWIQLQNVPKSLDHLMLCINYLIKYKNVNLPLYDENYNLVYLGDIIRFNLDSVDTDPTQINVSEEIINVDMLPYEKIVYGYFIEYSQDKLSDKFNMVLMDTVNEMSINSFEPATDFVIEDMCAICMNSMVKDKCTVTTCNHQLCVDCALSSIRFSHKCPFCRTDLDTSDYRRIGMEKCSKVNKMNLPCSGRGVVVYNRDNIGAHLACVYEGFLIEGGETDKLNCVYKFNQTGSGIAFLQSDDVGFLGAFKNLDYIVFFDIPDANARKTAMNPNIFSMQSLGVIRYLVYKNTYESKKIEKILKN